MVRGIGEGLWDLGRSLGLGEGPWGWGCPRVSVGSPPFSLVIPLLQGIGQISFWNGISPNIMGARKGCWALPSPASAGEQLVARAGGAARAGPPSPHPWPPWGEGWGGNKVPNRRFLQSMHENAGGRFHQEHRGVSIPRGDGAKIQLNVSRGNHQPNPGGWQASLCLGAGGGRRAAGPADVAQGCRFHPNPGGTRAPGVILACPVFPGQGAWHPGVTA